MSNPESTYWFDQRYEDALLAQHRKEHDGTNPTCHFCRDEIPASLSLPPKADE